MAAMPLRFDAVSFDYGASPPARLVIDDLSLAVEPGEIVGILGPNGAGKSTLLRLASGLVAPSGGRVLLGGRDLQSVPRAERARQIALAPQTSALPPTFTGWEVVMMGRTPYLGWFAPERAEDAEMARQVLRQVDGLVYAERRIGDLSGGERQRILLARALAQQPRVLLLDEPTTHLDLAHQVALLDLVGRLARQEGLAIVAVFHDLNIAAAFADRLALLVDGRLRAVGTPAAVLQPPLLRSVFGVDLLVMPHPVSGRPSVLLAGRPAEPAAETPALRAMAP